MIEHTYETNYIALDREALEIERAQAIDEGRDFDAVQDEYDRLHEQTATEGHMALQEEIREFHDRVQALPLRDDFEYEEPSDLAGIRAERPEGPRQVAVDVDEEELYDRIYGAWLGRCAGCLLGAPVEGWRTDQMWGYLKDLDRYPLDDYFRADVDQAVFDRYGIERRDNPRRAFLDEIDHMPENDDTTYTIVALALLRRHGFDFESADVARFWTRYLPLVQVATAERVAYRNFADLVYPPESATRWNPYREMIGAQIRADFYGYVSLGDPEQAAELAWRDARISHVKNGIYGAMWVAAMLAAAPAVPDPRELVEVGLSEVPENSRLTESVHDVLDWYENGADYDDVIDRIHDRWDETVRYDWVHTIGNAQILTAGLLYGDGEFGPTVCKTVQACLDTDSNGATAGSIVGMIVGASGIPDRWTDPLDDRINTGVAPYFRGEETPVYGYDTVAISRLARETVDLYDPLDA
jgi:ADP-ribosylglycohydrolase